MKKKAIIKTPLLLQMEATECGAASLGSVIAYYGLFKPLEELRKLCGINRNGSNATNILLAGEKLGLAGNGFMYSAEELKTILAPVILHWAFNHFIVYEGYDSKKNIVHINDPAYGHRQIDWEEFETSYTGIAIVLRPTATFKTGGKQSSIFSSVKEYLSSDYPALWLVLLVGLFLSIVGVIVPIITQVFFDEVLTYKHREWLFEILLALIIAVVLKTTLTFLRAWCLQRWQTVLTLTESANFLAHVLRLPMDFFQQRYAGEIATRVQFNDSIISFVTGQLATTILDMAVALFYLFLLFFYNVKLTIIGLVVTATNVGIMYYTFQWMTEQQMKIQQASGKTYALTISGLSTIETLKANGNEQDFFVKWASYNNQLLSMSQKTEYFSNFISLAPTLLGGVNTAMIMAVGGFAIMDGFMTMGIFVAFQGLMSNFQAPVNKTVGLSQTIQQTQSKILRLKDVLAYPIDSNQLVQQSNNTFTKSRLTGKLEMRTVSYGYSPLELPLIKKFNLQLSIGRRVAIVGGSGSGKSTISKLIAGFYHPWSGEILFDDIPAQEIPRAVLANSISIVEQEIYLFEGTIAENISLFDYSIPRSDIVRAAKDACMHHDISQLNGGYDAKVDEGGYNFSGGQRQRLEIARALASNPSLLIFDEATSALDPITERDIMINIRRRGASCVIVAHRLSTIRDCDEIIVLSKGRVVERGDHETLLAKGNHYCRLVSNERQVSIGG